MMPRLKKQSDVPEKSWDTEDVDGDVDGMRMVGAIESELKNRMRLYEVKSGHRK